MKRMALINDLSGFGRCSLTVSLPIISYLKVECCPVPTSILSNHTAFDSFYMTDLTPQMPAYIRQWKDMGLHFDGIYTGFLGSADQIAIVKDFILSFKTPQTCLIVDPVMGDDGQLYPTYTSKMADGMKELVALADIITPNLTEACSLTGRAWKKEWSCEELESLAKDLRALGPEKVVISGIEQGNEIISFLLDEQGKSHSVAVERNAQPRPGTGDVFASIIAADAVKGLDFYHSVKKASHFVKDCLAASDENHISLLEGVCFEEILDTLPQN